MIHPWWCEFFGCESLKYCSISVYNLCKVYIFAIVFFYNINNLLKQDTVPALGHSYECTVEGTLVYGVADDSRSGLAVHGTCSFVGGAIEANSIAIGSVKNNTKGILNLTNTATKGNGLDNIGSFRWMFGNGEVNCVGNTDKTGTAVCMGKSGTGYLDLCRGMTFDMTNYDYGIGEWYASSKRYIGVEKGIIIICDNVTNPLHAQKNTYLYTHSFVEMEYTHEGKTGLAIVNIEYASQTFKGNFKSFDEFVFPTVDNYNKVTCFVSWVETE